MVGLPRDDPEAHMIWQMEESILSTSFPNSFLLFFVLKGGGGGELLALLLPRQH